VALAPEYIGPYRVLRPIAAGGMAEVYEVQDPTSGERLALKLLVAVRAALDRFNREYEAMTRLNHPNIVRVYHYGLHNGHPWLTLELLRGVPAQSQVKQTGRPGSPQRLREVLRIGYYVAKALNYIHERNLVHRDLKSANVLVLPDDRVKLLDFGAAHIQDGQAITLEGEFVGTFAYAAPEQILAREVDHRTDLYSLGVLLYRLATGRRPFSSKNPKELAKQHLRQAPADPRSLVESLPAELADLILKLLAKKPKDRPQSALSVARSLEALHGRPFSTRSRLAVHDMASASRESERRMMWERLQEGPPASLTIVEGDDGSDRVRFLERIVADATERNWPVFSCSLHGPAPLTQVVDTLIRMGEATQDPAVATIAATLRRTSTPEGLANPSERGMLRKAAVEMAQLAADPDTPTVLAIKEVHLADGVTLEVIGGLRRALQESNTPLKLVASARTADLDGDSEIARRLGGDLRIKLNSLTPREVAVAVGNMLGRRPPPAELARKLHAATAGQPLYVEQSVQMMVAAGGIEAEGSRLAWADQAMEIPAPSRAGRTATAVLRGLPISWRRVLEALAIAEDASEPLVLARAVDWTVPELAAVLEGLISRGLVRWDIASKMKVAFRHPLLADIVRNAIHACRLAALRRNIARAVTGMAPSRGGTLALIAVGRQAEAVAAAAVLSRNLLANQEVRTALEVLEPVLGPGGEAEGDGVAVLCEAYLNYARCLRAVRPTDPANARALSRARELARGDGPLSAQVDLAQARLYKVIGHYGNFRKYLTQAWERTRVSEPELRSAIATELARSYRWHGDRPKAETWVERALATAEAAGDAGLFGEAVLQSAACRLARGRFDDAEQSFSEAMQAFERAGNRGGFWRALARWATTLRLQGRYSEALSQLYQRLPEASQSQESTPYVELLHATAWLELDLARLGRAQEYTDELASTVHRGEHLHLRLETQLLNGRILMASGQFRNAAYTLQEVHRSARNAELPVLSEQSRALLAEVMHAMGDHESATAMFQSAVLGLLGTGDVTVLAEGIRGRARAEAGTRDPADIFRPVARLLDEEPMALLHLEKLLALGAWYRGKGDRVQAHRSYREAAMLVNQVASGLNDTDRAALRVHPWSNWIRQGLR